MKVSDTFRLVLFIASLVILSTASLMAKSNGFVELNLTEPQVQKLTPVSEDFIVKESAIDARINKIEDEMVENLRKGDRFSSEAIHRIRISRMNMLLKSLGAAHGELLKLRVAFLVKARNILKRDQMELLIDSVLDSVEVFADFDEDEILGIDLTDPDWDIDLTIAQERSIIDYYAHRDIQRIRLMLAFQHQLLDIEELILSGNRISAAADDRISEIGEVAARVIDNEVQAFVITKDVLTIGQKKEMLVKLLLARH